MIRIEIEQGCDVSWFQWFKIAGSCIALSLSIGMMKENKELRDDDYTYEIPKQWPVLIGPFDIFLTRFSNFFNDLLCCMHINSLKSTTNPPIGSMGKHESWKNHARSACRCVTTLFGADSRLPICRTAPREKKSMKDAWFLFPNASFLPIEPWGGLDMVRIWRSNLKSHDCMAIHDNFRSILSHRPLYDTLSLADVPSILATLGSHFYVCSNLAYGLPR